MSAAIKKKSVRERWESPKQIERKKKMIKNLKNDCGVKFT